MYVHTYTHMFVYLSVCLCMYVCMYVCTYVCVNTYVAFLCVGIPEGGLCTPKDPGSAIHPWETLALSS